MTSNINVTKYPNDEGKLYRSDEGVIYAAYASDIVAIGHDFDLTGHIFPFNSTYPQSLVAEGVKIDDNLARKHQSNENGLISSCLVVKKTSLVYNPPVFFPQTYQPVSLFKRALNYIVKNPEKYHFNLELLPKKLKWGISFRLELNKTRSQLEGIKHRNLVTITELKHLNENEKLEKKRLYRQEIHQLEKILLSETAKLQNAANKKEIEMLLRISELEALVLEYS